MIFVPDAVKNDPEFIIDHRVKLWPIKIVVRSNSAPLYITMKLTTCNECSAKAETRGIRITHAMISANIMLVLNLLQFLIKDSDVQAFSSERFMSNFT